METFLELAERVRALQPNRPADADLETFTTLSAVCEAVRHDMLEHMREEEEEVQIRYVRMHMTQKQWGPIDKQIQKKTDLSYIGMYMHACFRIYPPWGHFTHAHTGSLLTVHVHARLHA